MTYMNCARCGLSVRLRKDQLSWDDCPRCIGRTGLSVPMYVATRRAWAPRLSDTRGTAVDAVAAELGRRG